MLAAFRRFFGFDRDLRVFSGKLLDPFDFFSALDEFQYSTFRRMRLRYREPGADTFCKLVAIKAANGLAADYHFRNRHSVLVSRPRQLQIDPTNACHLKCPSCLHTANPVWGSRFDWPSATLALDDFRRFCDEFAPFATGITLFRDGEPLLHRRFPDFVKVAKSYLLYTLVSTSLSMRIDAEALVASRLDRLVAAIDGASIDVYRRYRRGGDFELVIENLRAIVRARKAQSSSKPWLVWQFLAFEHNAHEIETAHRLARDIGVDQLVIAKPHTVEHDDPSIRVAEQAAFGETLFSEYRNWCEPLERAGFDRSAARIDGAFDERWAERYARLDGVPLGSGPDPTCNWLYYNLTMDAARRVTPCCLPPMKAPEPRHLVFSHFNGSNAEEVLNSPDAVLARRECRTGRPPEGRVPYCIRCTQNPQSPMRPDLAAYLLAVDEKRAFEWPYPKDLEKA